MCPNRVKRHNNYEKPLFLTSYKVPFNYKFKENVGIPIKTYTFTLLIELSLRSQVYSFLVLPRCFSSIF